MTATDLAGAVTALIPRAKDELAELVSYRSVADPRQFPQSECQAAAAWLAQALGEDGFVDVELLDTPDGSRSVYGYLPGPEHAPTVLLYGHYDVQPPLDEDAWLSSPFELTERDGRWYGRGTADCKGGLIMHLTALRALRQCGGVPVNIKLIAEGSEEQGTGGLERYAEEHPELLAADAIVIGDSGNFRIGIPTATSSLRGFTLVEITVDTLEGNLHSGQFGGVAPDALIALIRMLDSLWDGTGATAVEGVGEGREWDGIPFPEEELFRADAKILDGVGTMGTGTVADRLWARPAIGVLGIDCPPVVGATPSIHATAKALLSLRIPPGIEVRDATEALTAHLEAATPWNARVTVTQRAGGDAYRADITSPAYAAMDQAAQAAYGQKLAIAGSGGGLPLCNALAKLYPEAEILLVGLSEPEAQIHAVNESVSPVELEKLSLTLAHFLTHYAAAPTANSEPGAAHR